MALEKTRNFIENASMEELTQRLMDYGIEFEEIKNVDNDHELIRINLTMEEIERLRDGEVIQTHLPWVQVGRRSDF